MIVLALTMARSICSCHRAVIQLQHMSMMLYRFLLFSYFLDVDETNRFISLFNAHVTEGLIKECRKNPLADPCD